MEGSTRVVTVPAKRSLVLTGCDFTVLEERLKSPGQYRVVFCYKNDTSTEFGRRSGGNLLEEFGISGPFIPNERPDDQSIIRKTTPCSLRSNEVIVTVLGPARAVKILP